MDLLLDLLLTRVCTQTLRLSITLWGVFVRVLNYCELLTVLIGAQRPSGSAADRIKLIHPEEKHSWSACVFMSVYIVWIVYIAYVFKCEWENESLFLSRTQIMRMRNVRIAAFIKKEKFIAACGLIKPQWWSAGGRGSELFSFLLSLSLARSNGPLFLYLSCQVY